MNADLLQLTAGFAQLFDQFILGQDRAFHLQFRRFDAREEHVFRPGRIGNPLRPERGFDAHQVFRMRFGIVRNSGGTVHIPDIQEAPGSADIVVSDFTGDHFAAGGHEGFRIGIVSEPVLDDEVVRKNAAVEGLIPYNRFLSLFMQIASHLHDQPFLELLFILQAVIPDPLLAFRAAAPVLLDRFIPADMDIGAREQFTDFIQNILEEAHSAVLSGADQVREHARQNADRICIRLFLNVLPVMGVHDSSAAVLRVRGQHGAGVTGDLNLRDHIHADLFGVRNHGSDLFLRIETLVVFILVCRPEIRRPSAASDFRKTRIFPDFQPPALVIHQMPVHGVHAAQGSAVHEAQKILQRDKMSRTVEHKAAV